MLLRNDGGRWAGLVTVSVRPDQVQQGGSDGDERYVRLDQTFRLHGEGLATDLNVHYVSENPWPMRKIPHVDQPRILRCHHVQRDQTVETP